MTNSTRLSRTALRIALTVSAFVTLGALGATSPAHAQGTWCAQYGGTAGGTNCGFYTYQQCRAAVSGIGGFCSPSPHARYDNGGFAPPGRKGRHLHR
jgi:Protein of unknown function (DUF3551)